MAHEKDFMTLPSSLPYWWFPGNEGRGHRDLTGGFQGMKEEDIGMITGGYVATTIEQYFIWGYYGTQYRVRFYPPFGV